MAKRNKNHQIRVSFHLLVKSMPDDANPQNPLEEGFTRAEFQRIVDRISDPVELDVGDDRVISRIKSGCDIPFYDYEQPDVGLHFGVYEGAYYGQRYRNNRLGDIDPDSLNLRKFFYLVTRLRDGRILVATTYHGQFGDYDGLRSCFMHILQGNYLVRSKTIKSISAEIGDGVPVELRLTYRKAGNRPERGAIFGRSGVFAVKASEFGDDFADEIGSISRRLAGDEAHRKRVLAEVVRQGALIEIDDEDIVGCTAVVRENGSQRTVYLLGDQNHSTKFFIGTADGPAGDVSRERVKSEVIKVMRQKIIPLIG